jgi:hypothetical protein
MEGEKFEQWMQEIETVRPTIDAMVATLVQYGAVSATPHVNEFGRIPSGELPYEVQFKDGDAVTTIRIVLRDHNAPDSDLVITNMTTLPDVEKSKGYGSKAIAAILKWALDNNLRTVRATQINNPQSAKFWQKNGFVATDNHLGDYVKILT